MGGQVHHEGNLTPLGLELLERMELNIRLLSEQMEHLWKKPTLTCDGFVIRGGKVLLVKRGRDPSKGSYALPGGIVEYGESTEDCVVREVLEETGLRDRVERLVGVFSELDRDPRGHFVTLLYCAGDTGGERDRTGMTPNRRASSNWTTSRTWPSTMGIMIGTA